MHINLFWTSVHHGGANCGSRGVVCSNSRPQPPPPPLPPLQTPPKVFEPVFLQFEVLGERVGAKGAEIFFLPFLRGYIFFTLCVCPQNTQNFVENSKMFEKHRKFFDP